MTLQCGVCMACCRLLAIPDLRKPAGAVCWHCERPHGGCAVHDQKPAMPDYAHAEAGDAPIEPETCGDCPNALGCCTQPKCPALGACGQYRCDWLASQDRADPGERMPREMRPNISGVMLGPRGDPVDDPLHLFVHVEPERPNAWRAPAFAHHLDLVRRNGIRITVMIGERRIELDPLPAE